MTAHGSVGGIAHEQREPPSGLSPFETLLELERWIVRANSYADSWKMVADPSSNGSPEPPWGPG
jgi:hypothetical protein